MDWNAYKNRLDEVAVSEKAAARWQTALDEKEKKHSKRFWFVMELKSAAGETAPDAPRKVWRRVLAGAVSAAAVVGLLVGLGLWTLPRDRVPGGEPPISENLSASDSSGMDWAVQAVFDNPDAPRTRTIQFGGDTIQLTYQHSSDSHGVPREKRCDAYPAKDIYKGPDGSSYGFVLNTDLLCYYHLVYDHSVYQGMAYTISDEEKQAAAEQFLFALTGEPDAYIFESCKPREYEEYDVVSFHKQIGGFPTDDTVQIHIKQDGKITDFYAENRNRYDGCDLSGYDSKKTFMALDAAIDAFEYEGKKAPPRVYREQEDYSKPRESGTYLKSYYVYLSKNVQSGELVLAADVEYVWMNENGGGTVYCAVIQEPFRDFEPYPTLFLSGEYEGFQYKDEHNDGYLTIFAYNGPGGDVTVPDSINGVPVKVIGRSAFHQNWKITTITLPDVVTNIHSLAFSQSCISEITMNGVTEIQSDAFDRCYLLSDVTMKGVKIIGENAFRFCQNLKKIELPDSLTRIGDAAFHLCPLEEITIPAGVTDIHKAAFWGCAELKNIFVDKNNQKYTDINGVLFNREKTKLCIYPEGKTDTYYAIPEGTKFIDCNSFSRSLTELVIPEGVTTIKNEFWFAWAATITVPRSVTKIESEILNGKLGIKTDVVIRCYEGSYAHEFAKDKGIKYELI